jgi:hypothetical protein
MKKKSLIFFFYDNMMYIKIDLFIYFPIVVTNLS